MNGLENSLMLLANAATVLLETANRWVLAKYLRHYGVAL